MNRLALDLHRRRAMKAIRIHETGGAGVLRYEEAPNPVAGPGQLVIRVRAAGVNPVDWKIRNGSMAAAGMPGAFPAILGCDVAGEVESVGEGVMAFHPGDRVYAFVSLARNGGYAELTMTLPAEAAPMPANLDFVQASAIPAVAQTAQQALFDKGSLVRGQRVLIHGAAGGVGSMAVQLAKAAGAHVIATASARNQDFLRELGADQPLDYTAGPFEESAGLVDLVIDTVGGETQKRSVAVTRPNGKIVTIVSVDPDAARAATKTGVTVELMYVQPSAADLERIRPLIEAGKLRPHVETVLPLAEAQRAHELSESGHARGKIVLTVP